MINSIENRFFISKGRTDKKTFDVLIVLISAYSVFLSLINNNVNLFFLGIALVVYIFIFAPANRILPILIFMMPLENMYRGNFNLQIVTIGLLILLFKLAINKSYKVTLRAILISLAVIIQALISSLMVQQMVEFDVVRIIVNMAIVTSYYSIYKETKNNYFSYMNYLILGCLVLAVLSISEAIIKYGFSTLFTERMYGVSEDPNYISSYFVISISLLVCRLYSRNTANGIGSMLLIAIFIFCGLLTQSRGFLLALIPNILFLFALLFKIRSSFKKRINLIIILTFIIGAYIYIQSYFTELIENIISRLSVAMDTGGTGRIDIWKEIISFIFSDILRFLFGASDLMESAAHNMFLDVMGYYGIIMMLLVIILYYYTYIFLRRTFRSVNPYNKKNYVALLPLFTMFISYFFLNALLLNVFFYTFILIVNMLYFDKEVV